MLAACLESLPSDVAVCAAAVADWKVAATANQKLKKNGGQPPSLTLTSNPDILATLAEPGGQRPGLVIGFAAETERVVEHAAAKRERKGCDWILANDVSEASGTFGGDDNSIHFIAASQHEHWPRMSKRQVAERLADRIAEHFENLEP